MRKNSRLVFAMLTKLVEEEGYKSIVPITQKYIFSHPYVAFLYLAGLDIYPIFTDATRENIKSILSKVNGVMLPGGMSSVMNPDPNDPSKVVPSGYTKAVKIVMEEAKAINDRDEYFPVFGICLGFEAMMAVEAEDLSVVEKKHEGLGYAATLNYTVKREDSRFLSAMSSHALDYSEKVKSTYNYHEYMTNPEKFAANNNLSKTYKIISLSNSMKDSFSFVSMIEGIHYPFYAVQFHPELAMGCYYTKIVVFPDRNKAAEFGRGMMWFMLNEAKKNSHSIDEDSVKNLVVNNPGVVQRDPIFNESYHLWD
jgi:gamma-glutamyl hydrolase